MKKIFTLILIVLVSLTSVAMAAKKPIKIARLPIIIQKNVLDYETSATLEMKLARAVNIPMNKTLKIAEYLPPKESSIVFGEIWHEMYNQDKKSKMSEAVKIFAEDTNADLIICPILNQYSQSVINSNISFESRLSSFVSAEMIIYDKKTGDLIDKKTTRRYNDSFNRLGTASYLAGECFDQLIKDTGLRQIIRSKRG